MTKTSEAIVAPFKLRSIYVSASQVRMAEHFDPLIPGQQLSGHFKVAPLSAMMREVRGPVDAIVATRSFVFVTRYEFLYCLADGSASPEQPTFESPNFAAGIVAEFVVDYLLEEVEMPSDEVIRNWGQGPVLMHSWSYWREYCHSTMLRMSLPATVLPIMVAQPPVPQKRPGKSTRLATDAVSASPRKRQQKS